MQLAGQKRCNSPAKLMQLAGQKRCKYAYFSDSRQVNINLSQSSALVIISANYVALNRVVINLLHNAVKFSRSGSSVELAINTIDLGNVEIAISDTGSGITNADQKSYSSAMDRPKPVSKRLTVQDLGYTCAGK